MSDTRSHWELSVAVPLTLKVFKGDALVAAKDYDRDIIKIGRLSSAHLCLDDEKVSRIHSVIEVAPTASCPSSTWAASRAPTSTASASTRAR